MEHSGRPILVHNLNTDPTIQLLRLCRGSFLHQWINTKQNELIYEVFSTLSMNRAISSTESQSERERQTDR